jgi:hypothetical protein
LIAAAQRSLRPPQEPCGSPKRFGHNGGEAMAKESKAQQETVERVMHEFKHGELESNGRKVRNPKQAIAIGLSEAGASNQQTPAENRKRERATKARERTGQTARDRDEPTRAELYDKAKKQDVPGRSTMSKAELAKAVG